MEKRISELNQTLELKDGCCFPVVQDGETKKVTFELMRNELKNEIQNEIEFPTTAVYGTDGEWQFVKFPEIKVALLWREITDLVSQLKISVPVTFNSVSSYKVILTPSRNGSIVTKFWEGDINGNVQRTTSSFYVACSRSSSNTINLNCLVVGVYN